ncbi:HYR domain-containing protein, partial [Candidatus Bipolaricaulota bacterium]|nr:HYR domain-containing protein [Candidatus Bipolaricaulota bacterium]
WTVTDDCDNDITCQQTITVDDTTDPVITTCPPNISVCNEEGYCSAVVDPGAPSASDNCDTDLTITGTRSDGLLLTARYPCGTTTITWTATDDCSNSVSCVQTIEVRDCEPPVISWWTKSFLNAYARTPMLPWVSVNRGVM